MKRVAALVALLASFAAHAALPRAVARAFLDTGVPLSSVAIVVAPTGAGPPLFMHQPSRPMTPASVMKLLTTLAALEILGRDFRFRTDAYLRGSLSNGTLDGDLVLQGHGDPKITLEQWQAFVAELRARGLARINGDLVLDRSDFALPPHDPAAFDGEPLKPYNVGPDALLVDFKSVSFAFAPNATGTAVDVTMQPALPNVALGATLALDPAAPCDDWHRDVGAAFIDRGTAAAAQFDGRYPAQCGAREWYVALLDHPHYVHAIFTAYFDAAGGNFAGAVREGRAPAHATPFATLESPPLYDIVRDVNKLSNNVMASQLFLALAAHTAPLPATFDKAAAAIRRWLARARMPMPELVIRNGSGLSRSDRISARSLARLLAAADASPVRDEFASSLAVAAVDGTVEQRFQDGSVAGQALLKTGSLEGVRALAGYVIDASGTRWIVVAIVNDPRAARARPALDALVQWTYANAAAAAKAAR
ncbi:MAG TPA: D-alanyl-D-alanine carboxypeptidase/D-alanyl-D-alanine-endopeptidase [Casimicrobiaceae bacterium]|jgi:D-alanyl-D-alanine carboxypeptidase/D-alanyl-D-alanine-endopeptidase (penicillin-binding protein 4)